MTEVEKGCIMENHLAAFFVTCFVAISFITGTSLVLVNSVKDSLYDKKSGKYKLKTEQAQKLRIQIRNYPNKAYLIYSGMAIILVIPIVGDGIVEKEYWREREWLMAGFSAIYLIWVLYRIRYFCIGAIDAFADDEYD